MVSVAHEVDGFGLVRPQRAPVEALGDRAGQGSAQARQLLAPCRQVLDVDEPTVVGELGQQIVERGARRQGHAAMVGEGCDRMTGV